MAKIKIKPEVLEVFSISREDFERLKVKPNNCQFWVLDKVEKGGEIMPVYSLYKGSVQVGVGDIIGSLPEYMKAQAGGFRASAFARSESAPEKPKETDFETYKSLVNGKGLWKARPDATEGNGKLWVLYHWFLGDATESLDHGDEWTEPVCLTGEKGERGLQGERGKQGEQGVPGPKGDPGRDGTDGRNIYVRFNASKEKPAKPVGYGESFGWTAEAGEASRWMSVKTANTVNTGEWGEPIPVRGTLLHYDPQTGYIKDEEGNDLGLAFSPVYWIDTEQVVGLTLDDRYTFDTKEPLRVNCYVSTPQGTRRLINDGEKYKLMCKVRDSREDNAEKTFELRFANGEWLLPLEDWYSKDRTTDFIELHLMMNIEDSESPLAIKLIQAVRDGEAGKLTEVNAVMLDHGVQPYVKNYGTVHEAKLEFGIPMGKTGPKGEPGDPFRIAKTYGSVEAMEEGYATDGVPAGGMVLIDTGNVEDEDNAKLYVKGDNGYVFLTDLSGAQGIKGERGEQGPKGAPGKNGMSIHYTNSVAVLVDSINWKVDNPFGVYKDGDILIAPSEGNNVYSRRSLFLVGPIIDGITYSKIIVKYLDSSRIIMHDESIDPNNLTSGVLYFKVPENEYDFGFPQKGDFIIDNSPHKRLFRILNWGLYVYNRNAVIEHIADLQSVDGIDGNGMFYWPHDSLISGGDYQLVEENTYKIWAKGLYDTYGKYPQVGDLILDRDNKLYQFTYVYTDGRSEYDNYAHVKFIRYLCKDGAPPDITISATVDNAVGTPSVEVTQGGTAENPTFGLAFHNLKGDKGEQGEKGDPGATGAEGLGYFRSSYAAGTTTTYIPLSTVTIPTGRSVKVGDLIIANNTYSYVFQVTAVSSTTAAVTYITSMRGATGAAGSNASISGVAAGGDLTGTYPNPTIASSVNLPGSPTTTTQAHGNAGTTIATTEYAYKCKTVGKWASYFTGEGFYTYWSNQKRGGIKMYSGLAFVYNLMFTGSRHECIALVGMSENAVKLTNLGPYSANNIYALANGFYINLVTKDGGWPLSANGAQPYAGVEINGVQNGTELIPGGMILPFTDATAFIAAASSFDIRPYL